jgi:hypothetical protein
MQTQFISSVKILKAILFLFFLIVCANIQAQPPLKARPLNIFTEPGVPVDIPVLNKSELSSCGASTAVFFIQGQNRASGTIPLPHGAATLTADIITYTPTFGFVGQDSLKYELECGSQTSTATVLINVQ